MSLEIEFKRFISTHIPDRRQVVASLRIEKHSLEGYAQQELGSPLEDFAQQHQLVNKAQLLVPERHRLSAGCSYQYRHAQGAEIVNELCFAEVVDVYLSEGSRQLVRRHIDGYVGWLDKAVLVQEDYQPSHRVSVLRAHVYEQPQVAAEKLMCLALGSELEGQAQEGAWLPVTLLSGRKGFVRASVVAPSHYRLTPKPASIITLAKDFLHAPYVWGGITAWGLDCSGLLQTVFAAHGVALPRDSDQQEALGREVKLAAAQEADLIFFEGHVGIYMGAGKMIHANAEHMRVTINPVHEVGTVRSVKRLL